MIAVSFTEGWGMNILLNYLVISANDGWEAKGAF